MTWRNVLQSMTLLAVLSALAAASPVIGAGAWRSWPTVNNDGVPFWDRTSADGNACNIGYFLAGGFGNCSNLKNNTPHNGLNLGGNNLEYYSNNDAITPFPLAAEEWTFTLQGRIAGSNTFEVGYYLPGSPLPVFHPLFDRSYLVGDTVKITALDVVALYLSDSPHFFRSNTDPPGMAAFRHTVLPNQFYFGFEDRPQGDWDMNGVVLSAYYVPEPGTYALIGAGLLGLGLLRRRMS